MLVLDCPEGYVCNVASTETYYHPSEYSSFLPKMTRCLKLGWMLKSIMEETLSTLASPTNDDINMKKKRRFEAPSSFIRGNKKSTNNGATSSSSSS